MLKGKLPLYMQVKSKIHQEIIKNLNPHDLILSEHSLMERYDVSRTTVRKAIELLTQEGILYKKHGIGTFVSNEKVRQQIKNYAGFSKQMEMTGHRVKYEVLEKNIIMSTKEIKNKLNLLSEEKIFHLERRALRDDEYLNLTKSFIPYKFVSDIEIYDFSNLSLYKILEDKYKIVIKKTVRGIEATLADYEIASILKVKEGIPILKFEGLVTANIENEDVIIEYFETYYRTDDTQFFITQKV